MRYRDARGYRGDDDIELDEETLAELNRGPVAPGKRPLTRNLGPPVGYVQRKVGGDGEVAPSARETLRRALGSPGQPLRQDLQRGFGVAVRPDLDAVRIHTDEQADAAAKAYGARALTVGRDIFFRAGEYDPDSYRGRHLIAHEVAHTLQQPGLGPTPQAKLEVSEPGDSHEKEADAFADRFVAGLGNEVDRSQPLPAITRIGSMRIHRKATDRKEAGSTSAAYLRKHGRRLMRQLKIRAMQAQLGNPGSAHARWRPGAVSGEPLGAGASGHGCFGPPVVMRPGEATRWREPETKQRACRQEEIGEGRIPIQLRGDFLGPGICRPGHTDHAAHRIAGLTLPVSVLILDLRRPRSPITGPGIPEPVSEPHPAQIPAPATATIANHWSRDQHPSLAQPAPR